MGSITFFGEFHIGTGTEAIFFSDHTDFFLPLAIGHLSCRVLKVCDLSTISQRPYLLGSSTLDHLFPKDLGSLQHRGDEALPLRVAGANSNLKHSMIY